MSRASLARSGLMRVLPDVVLVLLGVTLRLFLVGNFDPWWGYDAEGHIRNIDHYHDPGGIPPLGFSREAYHPPLFYAATELMMRLMPESLWPLGHWRAAGGVLPAALKLLQLIPVVASALRLSILAVGLRAYLPGRPHARFWALALAAVLPVSVHQDAMVSNECLNILFVALALLVMPWAFRDDLRAKPAAVLLGISIGLALLSKYSAFVAAAVVGLGAIVFIAAGYRMGRPVGRGRLVTWSLCGIAVFSVAGWFYARNYALYQKITPTPYDRSGWDGDLYGSTGAERTPYLLRRPPRFFFGWSGDIFRAPFWPATLTAEGSLLQPVLVASTFVDFYDHGFSGAPLEYPRADDLRVNGRVLRRTALTAARISFVGGVVICLATVVSWGVAMVCSRRRRDFVAITVLLLPVIAVLGQIHYAVTYPIEEHGVVKGAYLMFAAPPLLGLFGLAVEDLWCRRRTKPLAVVLMMALAAVATYTLTSLWLGTNPS